MKFDNPTSVLIGMSGTFAGIRYTVVGRVVMSVEEDGETYYWNEFNLAGNNGEEATLVYESIDNKRTWKLFTLFEPRFPVSVREAALKQIGDTVNLEGSAMKVTLIDESYVEHIEGVAPEGVEVGDVAHYFNAEIPGKMLVVSWTGEEIEFYHGMDLPTGVVPHAFGLLRDVPKSGITSRFKSEESSSGLSYKIWVGFIGVFLALMVGFAFFDGFKDRSVSPPKPKLEASQIALGKNGYLDGKSYRITSDIVVEIAQVGQRYDRREYGLVDDEGNAALLVCSAKRGVKSWVLYRPFEPKNFMNRVQAAATRTGDTVTPEATPIKVTELFQTKILQMTGDSGKLRMGELLYGFNADNATNRLLVRWNENFITYYYGKICAEKTVLSAFK